jgi:hypothetical protein
MLGAATVSILAVKKAFARAYPMRLDAWGSASKRS